MALKFMPLRVSVTLPASQSTYSARDDDALAILLMRNAALASQLDLCSSQQQVEPAPAPGCSGIRYS